MTGPKTAFAEQLHAEKYRVNGESFKEAMNRVAGALTDNEQEFRPFRDLLYEQRFMPAGRVQAAVGATRRTTAYNCLAGDTKILTVEHGSIEIEKVANKKVTLLDGNGHWVLCNVHDHGEQDTVALTMKGGFESVEVRSTLHHGWVAANDNEVILTKAFIHESGIREIADLRPTKSIEDESIYKMGVVHGLFYGDGTAPENDVAHIRLCSQQESLGLWLDHLPKSYPPSYDGDPVYYLSRAKMWCDVKELPVEVSQDYLLGFLRGWFAADGCVSTQPEATICGSAAEMSWLEKWGPLVGWHTRGFTTLAAETNYGSRKKISLNIRLKKASMSVEDFLIEKHRDRWVTGHTGKNGHTWRVNGAMHEPKRERVYCPVVPTTQSFALSNGIHSRNCFVSPAIEDTFVDGPNSIMGCAGQAATTMRMGGGIGYDFSTLRPRGDMIKKLQSKSSGPVSFMEIFDAVGRATSSAGHRRGAQMGVLRVDHPDIEEFVHAKQKPGFLTGFNMSVGITDKFMESLATGKAFELVFNGRIHGDIDAAALWEQIMRSTYDYAEPGVLFIDTINRMNNLNYCETIAATNPCGEQPLPPYGACLLGSFNLAKYITASRSFDWAQFRRDIPIAVAAMDRVTDVSLYPLEEQEHEAKSKRRMGLGVTGLANAIEAIGPAYGSDDFVRIESRILETLRDESYRASMLLARERGAFPLFDADRYCEGEFINTLPHELQADIFTYGIRNSHLTSIAPTGTISMCADNVSSGIEPVFALRSNRIVNLSDGAHTVESLDYGLATFGVEGKTCDRVTVQEHLDVLVAAAERVDSAVSKTCNVPSDIGWSDFKGLYVQAYERGAKGCTTYRVGGKREGILTAANDNEDVAGAACVYDPSTGVRTCE